MVLLILGCFTICWLPYFIVACSQIYKIIENSSAVAYMAAFTLAMSNSAMNPVIYAWKNSNFRQAFTNLLKCKSPDTMEPSQSMRSNLHRKSSSAQHQDQLSGAFPNYSTPPFMQRKIEPINAMGITFEEDEDKISTHEPQTTAHHHPVTIKIESDINSSIVVSTTTKQQQQLDENSVNPKLVADTHKAQSKDETTTAAAATTGTTLTAGNLIVNKLMENYGYEGDDGDDIKAKFKENFLNTNNNNCVPTLMNENSKIKSKSTNSIVITKCPNKSNSHGSIFDHTKSRTNDRHQSTNNETICTLDSVSTTGKSSLLPSFTFGRKYISKSFNNSSSTTVVEKVRQKYGSSDNNAELNFHA